MGSQDNTEQFKQINTKNQNIIKEAVSEKEIEYDDLLSSAGELGRYQLFLFILTFPFYIYGVFSYFAQLFMTEVSPNHWCWVPELENFTDIQRRDLAIPPDPSARYGYSQCETFVANWTHVLETGQKPNDTWQRGVCQYGWEFNKSEIPYPTISSELGWVCEKNSYQATAQSIFFIGSIVGGFLIGWVADRFGRIPAAISSNIIGCVAGVITIYSKNFIHFSLCRFLMGMSYDNCMMMTYLLLLEYVAPRYRTIMANMSFAIFFTLGAVALPWIALACGNWKILSLATSIPMGLSLLAPFIVPESPRWLLSKGRVDEAINKIQTMAKVNKKVIPAQLIDQFKLYASKKSLEKNTSIINMLKRPVLRKVFIFMCLEYMCCIIIFDALVRSIGGFDFDFFLSFTFLSLTEFPSLLLMSFTLDFIGRKWMSIFALLICCFFSILTAFVSTGLPSVLCAIIARFAINISCNTVMQWAAEILPTSVRGSGVSIVHISSYLAIIISPYIVYLNNFISWLPLVIIGGIAALGATVAFFIPETTGYDMPHTFDEAEELIKNQKLFDIPCLRKNKNNIHGEFNSSFEMN